MSLKSKVNLIEIIFVANLFPNKKKIFEVQPFELTSNDWDLSGPVWGRVRRFLNKKSENE